MRHSAVISYTVCTFDQQPWIIVFRFFKAAWICARAENGKQIRVHRPLFLLSSNISWLFRFLENSVMLFHVRLPSFNSPADRVWVCFISVCLCVIQSTLEGSVISFTERGECFNKCVNLHPCETSACVSQVCMIRLAVTGCVWISKHRVHSLAYIILTALTSSPHNPQSFSLWFLLTKELHLLYKPPFLYVSQLLWFWSCP